MSTPLIDSLNALRHVFRTNEMMKAEFGIVTLVLGELETISKRPGGVADDTTALTIIRKLAKANEETLEVGKDVLTEDKKICLRAELSTLNMIADKFTPKQLSREAIFTLLQEANVFNMGEAMKLLKTQHAGQYDGKAASGWVKEYFAE